MGNPAKYGSHDRAERGKVVYLLTCKEAGKVEKEAAPNCSSGGTVAPSVDSQLQARGY